MALPFIGEIRMFAGNFAPSGWAFCDGQLLAVSQFDALFSLLGTIYGGDGRTTFGLPDMRGRIPVHAGTGPGLSNRVLGEKRGVENVTLTVNQLPAHSHPMNGSRDPASASRGPDHVLASNVERDLYINNPPPPTLVNMSPQVSSVGGSQRHTNIAPFLCIHFIIALVGVFPSRT